MSVLRPEVLLSTSFDERFPAANILDGTEKTFYLTSGMYPQEVLLGFGGNEVNVQKVQLICHGVKALRIERCTDRVPTTFEPIVDCELQQPAAGLQREQFQINKATMGTGITYVKLVVLSSYETFASVHSLTFEGDGPAA